MTAKDALLWHTDLVRAALAHTDDAAEAVLAADVAFAVCPVPPPVALGLDAEGNWHGPQPPAEGWVEVGKGPKGGKVWKKTGDEQPPKPPPTSAGKLPHEMTREEFYQSVYAHGTTSDASKKIDIEGFKRGEFAPPAQMGRGISYGWSKTGLNALQVMQMKEAGVQAIPDERHGVVYFARQVVAGEKSDVPGTSLKIIGKLPFKEAASDPYEEFVRQASSSQTVRPPAPPPKSTDLQVAQSVSANPVAAEALKTAKTAEEAQQGSARFALEEHFGSEPPGPGWIYSGESRWVRGVRRAGPKVAVVGGGPGGLFATYILNQRLPEAEVTLFEATHRLGGKILTGHFPDGTPFEAGVAELYEYKGPGGKDALRRLIEEDLSLPTVDMAGGGVVLKGKLTKSHDDLANHFSPATADQVKAFHAKCAELMPLEQYTNRWQPSNDHPWAQVDLRTCIECEVDDEAARDYIETAAASDLATESHSCNGLNGIKNVLLDNDDYMQLYHVRGGIGRVAEALGGKFVAETRLGATVTGVARTGNHYGVRYRVDDKEESETFDAVIVALPNHWWRQIDWGDLALKARLREVMEHYDSPAHYLRVSLLFSENWWAKHQLPGDFWMWDGMGGCCAYDESHRWGHTGNHALSFLLAGQDALNQRSSNQSDAEVIDGLIGSLPDFMREQARRTFLEGRVDSYVGSINAQPGGFPVRDLKEEHRPDPKNYPGLFLVCDAFFDSTLNGCLISASCAVDCLLGHLGKEGQKGSPAVEALRPDGLGLSLTGARQ